MNCAPAPLNVSAYTHTRVHINTNVCTCVCKKINSDFFCRRAKDTYYVHIYIYVYIHICIYSLCHTNIIHMHEFLCPHSSAANFRDYSYIECCVLLSSFSLHFCFFFSSCLSPSFPVQKCLLVNFFFYAFKMLFLFCCCLSSKKKCID